MPTIEVEGKKIALDEEGYLVHYEDWNEKVACVLAEREKVGKTCPMTKEKLEIIKFMRGYYKEFQAFPVPPGGLCQRSPTERLHVRTVSGPQYRLENCRTPSAFTTCCCAAEGIRRRIIINACCFQKEA